MSKIISVRSAVGMGHTALGAFDAALHLTGVANRNLIRLSSVVPEGAVVSRTAAGDYGGRWGDKLYVVYAAQYATQEGEIACAGIGWGFDPDGNGLLVEHEGTSEAYVQRSIDMSLTDLFRIRGLTRVDSDREVIKDVCTGLPICAFVVAVFENEGWHEDIR